MLNTERDELAEDIRGLGITVIDGPPVDLTEPLAQHLHNLGYRKPAKVKGNSPRGLIRELFKHLDHWEKQEHRTVGIDYLRRHFKDAA